MTCVVVALRCLAGLDGVTGRTGKDVLVKVCGVTRPEDALAAVGRGANLIGSIYCTSKRKVDAAKVRGGNLLGFKGREASGVSSS